MDHRGVMVPLGKRMEKEIAAEESRFPDLDDIFAVSPDEVMEHKVPSGIFSRPPEPIDYKPDGSKPHRAIDVNTPDEPDTFIPELEDAIRKADDEGDKTVLSSRLDRARRLHGEFPPVHKTNTIGYLES